MNTLDNIISAGFVLIMITLISWCGFNWYKSTAFINEQEIKKLTLDADQLCALQPITNQTEFCRDRINFLNQNTIK